MVRCENGWAFVLNITKSSSFKYVVIIGGGRRYFKKNRPAQLMYDNFRLKCIFHPGFYRFVQSYVKLFGALDQIFASASSRHFIHPLSEIMWVVQRITRKRNWQWNFWIIWAHHNFILIRRLGATDAIASLVPRFWFRD